MKSFFLFLVLQTFCFLAVGEGLETPQGLTPKKAPVDLPVLDYPFMTSTYPFPSMGQSEALSTDFYFLAHRSLESAFSDPGQKTMGVVSIIGFDILSNWIPPGRGWMHESWHQAVMRRRNINSFNDMNTIPIGKELIAVSHVEDNDLVQLKRDHPEEQVRLSSAGMESQVYQNIQIEKKHFFAGVRGFDQGILWMNASSVTGYLSTCASDQADSSTDSQNRDDGSDIGKRDFTGLDCTAWVYDLFRPDEPYTARGTHPSGRGINRYIKHSQLSDSEKAFLNKQVVFSLMNFFDPYLIGFEGFHGKWLDQEFAWNARMSHYLTSFGYTIDANLFLKTADRMYLLQMHNGFNQATYFPGLTLAQIDMALPWDRFFLTPQLTVWPQPSGQRYDRRTSDVLAAAQMKLSYQADENLRYYVDFVGKTRGWMAGNVYIEDNVSAILGVSTDLFL